jgi:voltage-gated potassium channel
LAAVLGNDADNLYVVLSARLINSKLTIIARATDEKARRKLEQAGATRVVSLYSAGAMKVASLLINPNVEEFVETLSGGEKDISLAEIAVTANSPFAGKALSKTDFSRRGVVIVGLRRGGGELLLPVPSHEEIRVGDTLIAMGKTEVMGPLMPASSAPQMVPPSRP